MSLKEKTVSGVKWNTLATANNAIVQIAKLMILARLLSKTDFGLIAIVIMLIGFFDIFASMGFSVGMIHKQKINDTQYSTLYWMNLLASILMYAVLCLISPLFVKFYNQPALSAIIPLMGLQLIINAFGKIFYTFKTKELEFKFISIVNIIGVYSGSIFTVVLAYLDFKVYSLVYGILLQSFIIQLTYAISGMKRYRILFVFNPKEILDIFKIGIYQVGTQVFDYISGKIDIFIIGRFFGMEMLGVYNLAKELVYKVIQIVNPIITNVATPAFSKIQDNLSLMQNYYLKILKMLSLINFPVFIAFFIFAEPLTLLVYGKDMMQVALFVRILSLWGLFNSVGNPAAILMVSMGRTDLGFYWTVVRILVTSCTILIAGFISIEAVAWSQACLAFAFLFLYWRMIIYSIAKIPLLDYLKSNGMAFVTSLIAGIFAYLFSLLVNQFWGEYTAIVLFFLLYLIINILVNKDFISEVKILLWPASRKYPNIFHSKTR